MKKKIDTLIEDIYSKINVLSEGKDLNLSKEELLKKLQGKYKNIIRLFAKIFEFTWKLHVEFIINSLHFFFL